MGHKIEQKNKATDDSRDSDKKTATALSFHNKK